MTRERAYQEATGAVSVATAKWVLKWTSLIVGVSLLLIVPLAVNTGYRYGKHQNLQELAKCQQERDQWRNQCQSISVATGQLVGEGYEAGKNKAYENFKPLPDDVDLPAPPSPDENYSDQYVGHVWQWQRNTRGEWLYRRLD